MRWDISSRHLAVAAAGSALVLTLGLTGTARAATGRTPALSSPVYTTSQAGYVAQGQTFRYVATTVTVPQAPASVFDQSLAEVVLGGTFGPPVTLAVPAGGGASSISYSFKTGTQWQTGHFPKLSPRPGDVLTLSIYSDQGSVSLNADDLTQHLGVTLLTNAVTETYNAAEIDGVVNNATVVPPASDNRLWEFTKSAVTTTAGVRGSMLGPWRTSEVIDTQQGNASSPVVLNAPTLWSSGENFGVWLRVTA